MMKIIKEIINLKIAYPLLDELEQYKLNVDMSSMITGIVINNTDTEDITLSRVGILISVQDVRTITNENF
jgi:hypothetical protein